MAWQSLRVAVDGGQAESLADTLLAAGALSVAIEDRDAGTSAEAPQFGEPGEGEPRVWQRNWVIALLPGDADPPALVAGLALSPGTEWRCEPVPEQDWVRLTQSQFEPIRVAERLWIVPSWHEPPDPAAVCLRLDPGLAFGTGSHPTTRLCLRWLAAHLRPGETVLDYGCGSGILAIAAVRLGAGATIGVDIDPQAVEAARDNARRNEVGIAFLLPAELPAGSSDVVVANILTNPLRALMPLLAGRVREGGRIVLSGILEAQAEEIRGLYATAFVMAPIITEDGWALLSGTRKATPADPPGAEPERPC